MAKLLFSVALALASPLGGDAFVVSGYTKKNGGYLCGTSPPVGMRFNPTSAFGVCGCHHGGSYEIDLSTPIKGFDGFDWSFSVSEDNGGRSIGFYDEKANKWFSYSRSGGGRHRQTLSKSAASLPVEETKKAKITKIRFTYGGRSSAPRTFYTYSLKLMKNGKQMLPFVGPAPDTPAPTPAPCTPDVGSALKCQRKRVSGKCKTNDKKCFTTCSGCAPTTWTCEDRDAAFCQAKLAKKPSKCDKAGFRDKKCRKSCQSHSKSTC